MRSACSARPGSTALPVPGDKDGYRNLSGRLRATWHPHADVEVGGSAIALDRSRRVRRLRPAHRRAYRHARQQPQPPGQRAGSGHDSETTIRPGAAQVAGFAARLVERNYLADVAAEPDRGTRRTFRAQLERRFVDRRGHASPHRRGRRGARDLPRARHRVRRLHRPGSDAPPSSRSRPSGAQIRSRSPATSRSAATSSTGSRTRPAFAPRCSASLAADSRSPDPMRKELPSRPSSISTASSPAISLVIHLLSRKARAGSSYRCAIAMARSARRSPAIGSGCTTKSSNNRQRSRSVLNAPGTSHAPASKPTLDWKLGERAPAVAPTMPISTRPSPTPSPASRSRKLRRPKHSGSIAADGSVGPLELWCIDCVCRRASRHSRHLPVRSRCAAFLLAGRCAGRLCGPARRRAVRPRVEPARSALSGCLRLPHRGARGLCRRAAQRPLRFRRRADRRSSP